MYSINPTRDVGNTQFSFAEMEKKYSRNKNFYIVEQELKAWASSIKIQPQTIEDFTNLAIHKKYASVAKALVRNLLVPLTAIEYLFEYGDSSIREIVIDSQTLFGKFSSTSIDRFIQGDANLRGNVALLKFLEQKHINILLEDPDTDVFFKILQHRQVTLEIVLKYALSDESVLSFDRINAANKALSYSKVADYKGYLVNTASIEELVNMMNTPVSEARKVKLFGDPNHDMIVEWAEHILLNDRKQELYFYIKRVFDLNAEDYPEEWICKLLKV